MNIQEILILAVALALDALITSFSYGLILEKEKIKNCLKLAVAFGFFQFLMPLLGWNFSYLIYSFLKTYSKWIVFAVFLVLGLKFIKEALSKKEDKNQDNISFLCLICLAFATSIDAFAAGISIRFMDIGILFPSLIIGIVTFLLSVMGFVVAGTLKKMPSSILEIIGASLLIYLAIKAII